MTERILNGRPEVVGPDWLIDLQVRPDQTWGLLDKTGARDWMRLVRATNPDGSVDIDATAANLGFPLVYSDSELSVRTRGGTEGLPSGDPKQISFILNTFHEESMPHTFGHEVGHVFLSLVLGQKPYEIVPDDSIELFCDYFGYEFALPSSGIEQLDHVDEGTVKELMSTHNLRLRDVLTRLMLSGKLPDKVAVDSRIPKGSVPEYSDSMCREYACLRCNRGEACDVYGDQIRVLRFPEEYWWGLVDGCQGGEPDYFWNIARREELNRQYKDMNE